MYFWNYGFRKKWLDKCLKTTVSDDLSSSNMVDGHKHSCILDDSTFTIFIDHCERNWAWNSLLVLSKILRLFVNTLTADEKYSLLNRDNLKEPIDKQLSKKPKTFCQSFFEFSKSTLNFKHLPKKDDSHS